MVNKEIHCGRLMIKKDGKVKKLDLCEGGGTRTTTWDHIDLDFDELHERLRKTYNIGESEARSHPASNFYFASRPVPARPNESAIVAV